MAASFGVVNQWHSAFCFFSEDLDGSLRCGKGNRSIIVNLEQASPRIKQLNSISSAVIHLISKQVSHGIGHTKQDTLG